MKNKHLVYLSLDTYPGTPTKRASEVRAAQNLTALRQLGYQITLVAPADPDGRPALADKLTLVDPPPRKNFIDLHAQVFYRRKIRQVLLRELAGGQAVLFCEHWPALVCAPQHPRIVYSCHDLEAALMRLRHQFSKSDNRGGVCLPIADYLEGSLLRKAARIVGVSASDCERIRRRVTAPVAYIPTVDPGPLPPPPTDGLRPGSLRLWYYGGRGATSNMIMLLHLRNELYELLKAALPEAEFHYAGAHEKYDQVRLEWLQRHFILHGFVENFSTVFRLGDICLIPYQYDTGFRTKIPEACGYGLIPAGYTISFACSPEMCDGYNCIMANSPGELARKIAQVGADAQLRQKLAEGALATRREDFSSAALLERYRKIMDFNL